MKKIIRIDKRRNTSVVYEKESKLSGGNMVQAVNCRKVAVVPYASIRNGGVDEGRATDYG